MEQDVQVGLRVGGHQVVGGGDPPPQFVDVPDLVEGPRPVGRDDVVRGVLVDLGVQLHGHQVVLGGQGQVTTLDQLVGHHPTQAVQHQVLDVEAGVNLVSVTSATCNNIFGSNISKIINDCFILK